MSELFERILGPEFQQLPPLLKQLHNGSQERWGGQVNITWGKQWLVQRLLSIAGIPKAGKELPCHVVFIPTQGGEIIRRNFSGQTMNSHLQDRGNIMFETMGPMTMHIVTTIKRQEIIQHCQDTRILGISFPKPLKIRIKAREWCDENSLFFDVCVGLECGLHLLRYRGNLQPTTR